MIAEVDKAIDLWEFYKKTIKYSDPLDVFQKDSAEYREYVKYVYDILNMKRPVSRAVHDWNAARSAMSMDIDNFEKAFWKFYKKPSEKTAKMFSKAYCEIYPAFIMARNAIFNNDLKRHWKRNSKRVVSELDEMK